MEMAKKAAQKNFVSDEDDEGSLTPAGHYLAASCATKT